MKSPLILKKYQSYFDLHYDVTSNHVTPSCCIIHDLLLLSETKYNGKIHRR